MPVYDLNYELRRFPKLQEEPRAVEWLEIQRDLLAPENSLQAYIYDLNDFFGHLAESGSAIEKLSPRDIPAFVRSLRDRPIEEDKNRRNRKSVNGLSEATAARRLSTIRLFLDYLVAERVIDKNYARRGPNRRRSLTPVPDEYPWIPSDEDWTRLFSIVSQSHLRFRVMFMLAYEAALRKEELCRIQLGDIDHAHHTISLRAETTKNKRARVLPYGDLTDALLQTYLQTIPGSIRNDESIFRSFSRRNYMQPITKHTWTDDVKRLRAEAQLPKLHPHTLRHLSLTDLARSGWDILDIRDFAGHKSIRTTERYIHLSGRDLKARYQSTMTKLHAQRLQKMHLAFSPR